MTTISDGAFSQGDVMRRLADLERAVANLSTARRLESASIGQGGVSITNGAVKIYDADGFVRAQIGKLPDGSYDIAAFDQLGTGVSLGALSFGAQSATVFAQETTSSTTLTDLTTLGPSVDVEIGASGRAFVSLTALLNWTLNRGCVMGFEVSGASTIAGDLNHTLGAQSTDPSTANAAGNFQGTATFLITDLTPGLNTFTAKYASMFGGSVQFGFYRNITVQPF